VSAAHHDALRRKLADARTNLDADAFLDLLADDAIYDSDENWPLQGKEAVSEYIRGRFQVILSAKVEGRDTGRLIPAVISQHGHVDEPCLLFVADGERQSVWFVSVGDSGRIRRIWISSLVFDPNLARPLA
jgi:hypothetical protein